jgi:hypothetical protein
MVDECIKISEKSVKALKRLQGCLYNQVNQESTQKKF